MIKEMALAIAESQQALDMNSIEVAQALAEIELPVGSVVLAIEQPADEEGNPTGSPTLVTNDQPMNLLTYGLQPRFYEFTESIIEVKMTISMKVERSTEKEYKKEFKFKNKTTFESSFKSSGLASFLFGKASAKLKTETTVAYTSTYNAKYKSKYTFSETGTSLLRTTLKPVPPPERSVPTIKIQASSSPTP
ncbi:hypothetical protein B6V01_000025 [Methanosarcinales archaeon ex4572_44]|nr:MAG: hypothetical protein B6U67_01845 [Methanosarcinales archaeon ex4484_138]PHP46271.1 MAG: hypothetical protein B6V01_000025 [Methanosarcinales archaeon ex4572_44]RLG23710.1 MAG: hypothetical protein DRN85_08875 [Methanosarcinales archaeon]